MLTGAGHQYFWDTEKKTCIGLTEHTRQMFCTVAVAWSSAFPLRVPAGLPELANLKSRVLVVLMLRPG